VWFGLWSNGQDNVEDNQFAHSV